MPVQVTVRVCPAKGTQPTPLCIQSNRNKKSDSSKYHDNSTETITVSRSPIRRGIGHEEQLIIYGEQFQFDRVFYPPVSQSEIFGHLLQSKILDMKHGINSCVFFHGSKKSGKSYTLHGNSCDDKGLSRGLLHRCVQQLIEVADELTNTSPSKRFSVGLRGYFVDGENINDIFATIPHPSLPYRMTQSHNRNQSREHYRVFQKTNTEEKLTYTIVEDTTHYVIRNIQEFELIMNKMCNTIKLPSLTHIVWGLSLETKKKYATNNDTATIASDSIILANSSQSIAQRFDLKNPICSPIPANRISKKIYSPKKWEHKMFYEQYPIFSQIYFVEIPSIDVGFNGTVSNTKKSSQKRKHKCIAQSLEAITTILTFIAQKNKHIPYRNTKLTTILQDCLTATCNVLVMLNVIPNVTHISQTSKTLRFGEQLFAQMVQTQNQSRFTKQSSKITNLEMDGELENITSLQSIATKKNTTSHGSTLPTCKAHTNVIQHLVNENTPNPSNSDLASPTNKIDSKNDKEIDTSLNSTTETQTVTQKLLQSFRDSKDFSGTDHHTIGLQNNKQPDLSGHGICSPYDKITTLLTKMKLSLSHSNGCYSSKESLIFTIDKMIKQLDSLKTQYSKMKLENDRLHNVNAKQSNTISKLTQVIASFNQLPCNGNLNLIENISNEYVCHKSSEMNTPSTQQNMTTHEPSSVNSSHSSSSSDMSIHSSRDSQHQQALSKRVQGIEARLKQHCQDITKLKQNIINPVKYSQGPKQALGPKTAPTIELNKDIDVNHIISQTMCAMNTSYECESFALESINNADFVQE